MILQGKVWRYGDNVDTDVIIPARYLNTVDPKELAAHCMEDIDTSFVGGVKPGDIIVAGRNFGCGSSREHAPVAIKASGVTCIIEMTPYATTIDWRESALVCFERGTVEIDLPAPLASNRPGRLEIFRDPGSGVRPTTTIPQLPWIHAMRQQAQNFIDAIRGEADPPCQAAEALEDLRVARQYIRLLTGE